jgi:hypothetical protein
MTMLMLAMAPAIIAGITTIIITILVHVPADHRHADDRRDRHVLEPMAPRTMFGMTMIMLIPTRHHD